MKGQNRISSTSNCFQVVTVQMKLNLSPAYIGRLKEGIWLKLTNYLMKYVREVDGVVVSFWDVSLHQPSGLVLADLPNHHFLISSKLLLFSPTIGSKMSGIVQQVGIDHISVLCYGYFSATIPAKEIPSHFIRDINEDCWKHTKNKNVVIKLDSKINFTVIGLNKLSEMMSILGSLLDQSEQ